MLAGLRNTLTVHCKNGCAFYLFKQYNKGQKETLLNKKWSCHLPCQQRRRLGGVHFFKGIWEVEFVQRKSEHVTCFEWHPKNMLQDGGTTYGELKCSTRSQTKCQVATQAIVKIDYLLQVLKTAWRLQGGITLLLPTRYKILLYCDALMHAKYHCQEDHHLHLKGQKQRWLYCLSARLFIHLSISNHTAMKCTQGHFSRC